MTTSGSLSTYLVSDSELSAPRDVIDVIEAAVTGGVSAVQIRDKKATTRQLYDLVTRAAHVIARRSMLIINDRVDVFLAAQTTGIPIDGVHLGQNDMPVHIARQLVGSEAIIGLSVSTNAEFERAMELPSNFVNYFGVGPIWPTATKPDHPEPLGIAGFTHIASSTPVPCIAIGGITPIDVPLLRLGGAAGVAVVSAICAAPDPETAARDLCDAWTKAG